MNQIKYIIHRYEPYGNPISGKLIAFLIINTDNDHMEYVDTILSLSEYEGLSDPEICSLAFTKLKDQIDLLTENLLNRTKLIGSEFVP